MKPSLTGIATYQAGLVLLLGLALGVAVNGIRPQGLSWAQDWSATKAAAVPEDELITAEEALALHGKAHVIFIDARPAEAFAQGHVPDAVSLPYDPFATDLSERIARLPPDKTFIVYCDGVGCPLGNDLAQLMRLDGLERVLVMSEGLGGWKAAGGEVR